MDNGINSVVSGGGGVFSNGAAITISVTVFHGNTANSEGGAGLCVNRGVLTLRDSEFRANTLDNPDFELAANAFDYNRYRSNFGNARGGGVHIGRQATGTFSGTLFTENTVRGWFSQGAGLYIDKHTDSNGNNIYDPAATVTVDSCIFTRNESVGDSVESYDVSGGGIYANHVRYSQVTNCTVENNLAISYRVDGSGNRIVSNDPSSVSVEDGGGGGIYNDGTMDIIGCTITGNELSMRTYGGARVNGNGMGTRFGGQRQGGRGLSGNRQDAENHQLHGPVEQRGELRRRNLS